MRSKWMILLGIAGLVMLTALLVFLLPAAAPDPPAEYDLNRDGLAETYSFSQGQLVICQTGGIDWTSPPEWNLKTWAVDDVTGDGYPELVMLLWKEGSFGEHRPWGYQQEDNRFSCHLFVYQLQGQQLLPRWCSSALDKPVRNFAIRQDAEGKRYLAIEEGIFSFNCAGEPFIFGTACSNWAWGQWGFYRQQ